MIFYSKQISIYLSWAVEREALSSRYVHTRYPVCHLRVGCWSVGVVRQRIRYWVAELRRVVLFFLIFLDGRLEPVVAPLLDSPLDEILLFLSACLNAREPSCCSKTECTTHCSPVYEKSRPASLRWCVSKITECWLIP